MLHDATKSRFETLREALCDGRPLLTVIVDTEEEFDWSGPRARENRSVTAIPAQARAHEVFARFGIVPTYAVDFPVAADPDASAFLRGYLEAGLCEIGAHLHPWVNPPDEEPVTALTSYAGNLPPDLERRKLAALTDTIERAFGRPPRVYRAGRYGIGPATPGFLADLGYWVDASVVPHTRFTDDGGPDFVGEGPRPRALDGQPEMMELPLSVGFAGRLRRHGPRVADRLFSPPSIRAHVPGLLARSGLLERIRLTPEGASVAEQTRLTRALLQDDVRVLSYSYHSPSLAPGNTPYVRDEADLAAFLDTMGGYFAEAIEKQGAVPATATEIYQLWRAGALPA